MNRNQRENKYRRPPIEQKTPGGRRKYTKHLNLLIYLVYKEILIFEMLK